MLNHETGKQFHIKYLNEILTYTKGGEKKKHILNTNKEKIQLLLDYLLFTLIQFYLQAIFHAHRSDYKSHYAVINRCRHRLLLFFIRIKISGNVYDGLDSKL